VTLKNKTVLVTGGTKGIGKAIVKKLLNNNYNVFTCARNTVNMDDFYELQKENNQFQFIQADLKDINGVKSFISKSAYYKYGWKIDILINNVGGGGSLNNYENIMSINYYTMLILSEFFLPFMIHKKWGRIITISSIYGKEPGLNPYFDAAKSAQIAYMKCMSKKEEYVRNGITFNSILPGHISSGYSYNKNKNTVKYKNIIDSTPMGKIGEPEDVANTVEFLCSEKSNYINGSCITVDGGEAN